MNEPFLVEITFLTIENFSYALSVSPKIHDFLEGHFDINYPIAKQDQAAIPDFNSGAMENWGLITYRCFNSIY
jgi:aminopeptidase N